MRRFVNCMNMLIFSFVLLEPLYLVGSESEFKNHLNSHTFSSIGGKRDSTDFSDITQSEHRAINNIIRRIFPKNVTASPAASPPFDPSPRFVPQTSKTDSSYPVYKTDFSSNITTPYYSTQDEGYPDFSVIAEKLKKYQGFSVKDQLPPPDLSTHTLIDKDAHQYIHLCRSETELITPRTIMDKKNRKVRVVNYVEYEQTLRAETCGEIDKPCTFSDNFPNNLKPICKQNYIFRQVLTMSMGDDPDLEVQDIPIPACCECVLKDMTMQ